jgi:hypothetical protein
VKGSKPLLKRHISRPKIISRQTGWKTWFTTLAVGKVKKLSNQTNASVTKEVHFKNRISWYRLKIGPHTPVCVGVPWHGCPKGPRDFCSTPGFWGTHLRIYQQRATREHQHSAHAGGCTILLILGRRFQIHWMFTRVRAAADDFLLWRPGCEVSCSRSQSVGPRLFLPFSYLSDCPHWD